MKYTALLTANTVLIINAYIYPGDNIATILENHSTNVLNNAQIKLKIAIMKPPKNKRINTIDHVWKEDNQPRKAFKRGIIANVNANVTP